MPTWAKVLLIVVALIMVAIIGVGAAGYYFVKHTMQDVDPKKLATEGRAFGAGKSAQQCLDEGLSRMTAPGCATSFSCQAKGRVFFEGCMSSAAPTPALCEGAPHDLFATASWAKSQCEKRGKPGDSACTGLMTALAAHCR